MLPIPFYRGTHKYLNICQKLKCSLLSFFMLTSSHMSKTNTCDSIIVRFLSFAESGGGQGVELFPKEEL